MSKNLLPKLGICLLLLFMLGSCRPQIDLSWRMMGWNCKTGLGYRGLNFYCR